MRTAPTCLVCDHLLLRHARAGGGIYWLCNHCHQEMPVLCQQAPVLIGSGVKGLSQIKLFSRVKTLK